LFKITICLLCRDYGGHKGHNIDLFKNIATKLRAEIQNDMARCGFVGQWLQEEATVTQLAIMGA
jgi:hypothetical protein